MLTRSAVYDRFSRTGLGLYLSLALLLSVSLPNAFRTSAVLFGLVLFRYRALAELDGPLRLGQRVHDAQVRILHQFL